MLLVSKPYLENCILTSYDNSLKKKKHVNFGSHSWCEEKNGHPTSHCSMYLIVSLLNKVLRVHEEAHIFQQLLEIFKQLKTSKHTKHVILNPEYSAFTECFYEE